MILAFRVKFFKRFAFCCNFELPLEKLFLLGLWSGFLTFSFRENVGCHIVDVLAITVHVNFPGWIG